MKLYRMLLRWAQILVKKSRSCGNEENYGNRLRCCALLGTYMAMFCNSVFPRECLCESRRWVYLGGILVLERPRGGYAKAAQLFSFEVYDSV